MRKIIYFSIIGTIFLLSFSLYSSLFCPFLNSDNAVWILMTHYYKLPNDLYYWGADRMGSLIPLIAQIPFKIFHLSALTSESIIHYLILLAGFLAFSSFLKTDFYKIIFAILWFFPPLHLIDVTQLSFSIYYSLIAIACYFFNLSDQESIQRKKVVYHFILICITLNLIAAVWVCDIAIVTVAIVSGIHLYYLMKEKKLIRKGLINPQLYYLLIGIVAGYFFIHYAKSFSTEKITYTTFSDLKTVEKTVIIFSHSLKKIFLFQAREPFTSLYSYMVLLITGLSFFMIRRVKFLDEAVRRVWFIFILDAIILFVIIIISRWTFLNNVPRRYFNCTYLTFSFALLLALDNVVMHDKYMIILKTLIAIAVVLGGAGTLYNLKYISPKTLTPMVKVVGEFQQLGKIGVISEYWNSYITSCVNPDMIKATPHDTTWTVRNYKIVDEVFEQKNIYIIKDCWLKTFPDTLKQFGRTLVKDGNDFSIGNCEVCKYHKVSLIK